ncbi:MAG: FHA domain-containing protein [Azonexus sp.]|nr:FHA domain-containing protein [Azonexus sp.]
MAKLVLSLNGTVIDQRFIDKPCLSIGRDAGGDIVINDPLLSREHARIVSVGEDHIVEDLKSSNGTLVNGLPLARQILQHRDVIHLGGHHLCYVNTRMAGEVDLERTMLIKAMPRHAAPAADAPVVAVPAMRAPKARLPEGCIKVLAGAGCHAVGENVRLERVVTTFGVPGEQLVVIARRPSGFFLTHVEGGKLPRVNRHAIDSGPHALSDGDEIEAAGYRLEFRLDARA